MSLAPYVMRGMVASRPVVQLTHFCVRSGRYGQRVLVGLPSFREKFGMEKSDLKLLFFSHDPSNPEGVQPQ